jgi:hypothetical protein
MTENEKLIRLEPQKRVAEHRFDQELIGLSQGITQLLRSNRKRRDVHVWATLDDFLGAIYALIFAFHNKPPFKSRPRGKTIDTRVVIKRARAVSESHNIRRQGAWVAGFHFNSALFRLDAVYHRSLKIGIGKPEIGDPVGDEKKRSSLIYKAKNQYEVWTNSKWENGNIRVIHREVAGLKHTPKGSYYGRDVNGETAVSAAKELLRFLTAWDCQSGSKTTS